MKKFIKLTALLIVSVMAFTLVACSSYGALERAFTKNGYEVSSEVDELTEMIKEEAEKEELELTFHAFVKKDGFSSDMVFVLEFKNTDELSEFIDETDVLEQFIEDLKDDGETSKIYNKLVDAGYVKGNCLIVNTNPVNRAEVVKIVKGEK